MPSSVEFSFKHMTRFKGPDEKFWVQTADPLPQTHSVLRYFSGSISDAPMYGFWAPKQVNGVAFIDLVYFFYYPYNQGKLVLGDVVGNHVGDWEHITVRLNSTLMPVQVYMAYHRSGALFEWAAVEKVESTHPVCFSAIGSHGSWKDAGEHNYGPFIKGILELSDSCSNGTAWDGWKPNRLVAFDWENKKRVEWEMAKLDESRF